MRMPMRSRVTEAWRAMFKRLLVPIILMLAFAPGAQAAGGHYVFDGGTQAEQAQVTAPSTRAASAGTSCPGRS